MDFKQYKGRLQEYVESVTTKSRKAGKRMYICPLCHSGTGKNKTGAFSITEDCEHWTCFACNEKGGDIYDLFQAMNPGMTRAEAYSAIERAYGTGTVTVKTNKQNQQQQEQDRQKELKKLEKIHQDINEGQKHLQEILESNGCFRGISEETLKANKVGYIDKWHSFEKEYIISSRVIIPTSSNTYVARATAKDINEEYRVIKQGGSLMLIPQGVTLESTEPVFVVEGEIDALSIVDAGGKAIALGGVGNAHLFLEALDKVKGAVAPIILAMDNDEAGRQTTTKLKLELEERNITYVTHCWQPCKDANELLQKSRQGLTARIQEATNTAREVARESQPTCYITTEEEANQLKQQGKRAVIFNEIETAIMLEQFHNVKTFIDRMGTDESKECIKRIAEEHQAGVITNTSGTVEELDEQADKEQEKQADKREEFINAHSGESILALLENSRDKAKKPFITGIQGLDTALGGGIYDGFYVLGGTTGSGKSNLAIQIADGIAEYGQLGQLGTFRDILYFSLEMGKGEIVARTLARLCNNIKGTYKNIQHTDDISKRPITTRDILDHSRHIWKKTEGLKNEGIYKQALNSYATIQKHLYYYDSTDNVDEQGRYKGAFTVNDILAIAKNHEEATGQAPILFIDYIQLIASQDYKDERSKVKDCVLALKEYCIRTNSTVFAITSFSRANYYREADIDSGKEAGEIEYTANVFIGLSLEGIDKPSATQTPQQMRKEAEKKTPREMKVAILKNRYGATKDLSFDFYPAINLWSFRYDNKEKKRWEEYEQAEASHKIQIICKRKPTQRQIKNFIKKYQLDINTDDIEEMQCIVWSNGILYFDDEEFAKMKKNN